MAIEYLDVDCHKCGGNIASHSMYLVDMKRGFFYCEFCADYVLMEASAKGEIKIS